MYLISFFRPAYPGHFEVLGSCCFDVIIREEVPVQHNVFEEHASCMIMMQPNDSFSESAHFDLKSCWQRIYEILVEKANQERKICIYTINIADRS